MSKLSKIDIKGKSISTLKSKDFSLSFDGMEFQNPDDYEISSKSVNLYKMDTPTSMPIRFTGFYSFFSYREYQLEYRLPLLQQNKPTLNYITWCIRK